MRLTPVVVMAASVVGLAASQIPGPTRTQDPPALTIESLAGKDTFETYCAPCHGRGGAGDGPVAAALRTRPADLRHLSSRRGFFPRQDVLKFVTGDGRSIVAHGTSDMPIWGATFRSLDPSDARVRVRIQNVVDFVQSLQQ